MVRFVHRLGALLRLVSFGCLASLEGAVSGSSGLVLLAVWLFWMGQLVAARYWFRWLFGFFGGAGW